MNKDLFRKFENSVNFKEKSIYLSNRRIIDFEGHVIGFFDTESSMEKYGAIVGEELQYIGPEDFELMNDFKCQLNEFLKEKGIQK